MWKSILEDVFEDFIRFMNPDADVILDLAKGVEFLDKELEQVFPPENNKYSPKIIDKLAKVFTRTGKEEWVLIHVEVQGQYHKDFAGRMFTYFYRLLDKYKKPVTAYAIFTEASVPDRPDTFSLEFMGTSLTYTFNTFKIAAQNKVELQRSSNPFAIVVLTALAAIEGKAVTNSSERDELLLTLKLELAKQLLSKDIAKNKIRGLMNFLKYYLRFENQEISHRFEEQIEVLTNKHIPMGIEEFLLHRAKEEGITAHSRKVVRNLIIKLGLSDEQIAEIAEVSLEFVRKIRSRLKVN